jgi:hypothetical protein
MEEESVVYGCIKNTAYGRQAEQRAETNRLALLALPSVLDRPLLCREMFAAMDNFSNADEYTDVVHFGASYFGIEYEWSLWIQQFEALLTKMYWVNVVVHLETELSGVHSFIWETNSEYHEPGNDNLKLRCEWLHER